MNKCPECGSPHGFSVGRIRTGRHFLGFYWGAVSGDLMECSGCHVLYRSTNEGVLRYKPAGQEQNVGSPAQVPTKSAPVKPKTGVTKWEPIQRQAPV